MWFVRLLGQAGPLRGFVTKYSKVLLLPATITIGFIGTQLEDYFRRDQMLEDKGQPPAWQRRSEKDLKDA